MGRRRRPEPFAVSPLARERKLYEQGRRYCEDLELRQVDEGERFGRYLLKPRKWLSYSWVEIVTVRGGVLVHGDCDTCFFSGLSGATGPRSGIYWQARVNPGYGAEKANRGGTESREFEQEVAAFYVLQWRRHKEIERELARDLFDGLRGGWTGEEFGAECYGSVVDVESIVSARNSVSWNVINAQCVLMRLVTLLERRDFQHLAREWFSRSAA
jgi:hypothetical protein